LIFIGSGKRIFYFIEPININPHQPYQPSSTLNNKFPHKNNAYFPNHVILR